ncbi:MAG: hypothetical protein H6626_02895 [Pseudobdellovibrionaceae bacterium]|nr:MAG: hypothetical protein H6626_02895 [Pseudobdellovibrionaceae bacterium]
MFDQLAVVAKDIRGEVFELYWILLVPLVLLLIILEFFKGKQDNIDVFDILRRVVISMLLLFSFDYTINVIGMIGDGIIDKIDKITDVWEVLKNLGPNYQDSSSSMFDLRGHILYVFALVAYIIAYLGFFVAEALTHFVWVVLFTVSPLMILAYVPKSTANVTANLYKGLVKVIIWKILWTVLGVLLLKLAMNPVQGGLEDYLLSIILNLCIGLSMLFIPIATRSLINDGMESAASALASAPAMAAATTAKLYATKMIKQGAAKTWGAGKFAAKPLTNPISGRVSRFREKIEPKFQNFKNEYADINSLGWKHRKNQEKIYRAHGMSYENPNKRNGGKS